MSDETDIGIDEILDDPIVADAVRPVRDAIRAAKRVAGDIVLEVDRERIREICAGFRRAGFDYFVDVTAVDYSKYPGWEGERFAVVYHLYSHAKRARVRLKVRVSDGMTVPSVTSVWKAANWPERETFDMFGIVFDGHPSLERILMWEGFSGFPLRKDFPARGIDTGARIYPEVFPEGGGPKEGSTGKDVADVNVHHGEWPAYGIA
ncbi:MAG: NADH-quinone oxidoreductase subunit C, partial [Thermoanaerobaculia bacterium]